MADASVLSALIERHCGTIRQFFDDFRAHYDARRMGEPPGQEAMAVLHTLKGSCGTIGFQTLHQKVATLHDQLKAWPEETRARDAYERKMTEEIAETAAAVAQVQPEDSTLYGRAL